MVDEQKKPELLADKLSSTKVHNISSIFFTLFITFIVAAVVVFFVAEFTAEMENNILYGFAAAGLATVILLAITKAVANRPNPHFLFLHDQAQFMGKLRLSEKTVLFDGNNIYHFGLEHGVGAVALKTLVHELRNEGYRIVCFFDANIFYTLLENQAFINNGQRFSFSILEGVFGLKRFEIYVVPSGQQADLFIIETLSHLPISFAVTNDWFKDYQPAYDFLSKDHSWRKGVSIKNGELRLYQHKFKKPLQIYKFS